MAGELQLLGKLISVALDILGVSNAIKKATEQTAQEHAPYAIETIASNGTNTVINPTYGNSALRALLLDVLSAIDVPNSTVVLPPTPPAGYGGGDPSDVWGYYCPQYVRNAYEPLASALAALQNADCLANAQANAGVADPRNPYFVLTHVNGYALSQSLLSDNAGEREPPVPWVDWSSWNGTDDIATFLEASDAGPGFNWNHYSPWAGVQTPDFAWAQGSNSNQAYWRCIVSNQLLPLYSGQLGASTPAATAPVWPGAANATLGTPVSIANGASSAEDCDGVIVAITGVPADQGSYQFGSDHSYVHLGQLAFIDDNGEYEDGQNFGFAAGIITPKRMAHAAGFVMRVKSGVSGTVTPWVNA